MECSMTAFRSFAAALHTQAPAPDRADAMGLYGWLVGDWEMDAIIHVDDGSTKTGKGEIHFGFVLEGRAIQDVWILPGVFFGTTLRVYDPGIDAWHILWSDPLRQVYARQIGRAKGRDIVQEGTSGDGTPLRWSFTEITPDSFRWLGERSGDGGETWRLQVEFFARRVESASTRPMIDHVSLGVRDVARAKRFYDAALAPLGYSCLSEGEGSLGYGRDAVAVWVGAAERPVPPDEASGLHFCFAAPTRASVDAFHRAALAAGGRDNGRPGLRPDYGADYYAAFVIDPDGYRIEAHCGDPER
jgi:catechol 2,3-dioxygenase-like lactoylglutathione lyase family enzyme